MGVTYRLQGRLSSHAAWGHEVITFADDDAGYLTWIAQHPQGYVLNTARQPTADYLIAHRATCPTISGTPARGEQWTRDFLKHCAEHRAELRSFARVECLGDARDCGPRVKLPRLPGISPSPSWSLHHPSQVSRRGVKTDRGQWEGRGGWRRPETYTSNYSKSYPRIQS